MRFLLTGLLAVGVSSLRAGAILQIDLDATLIPEDCHGQLQATMFLHDNPAPWPATGIFGPDGMPLAFHLVFNYDDVLQGGAVDRIDLQAGAVVHSWQPAPFSLVYPPGPAFPFAGLFDPFPSCATALTPASRPQAAALESILPNPCNPDAQISFRLDTPGLARLSLYNLVGQRLQVLAEGYHAAGIHRTEFRGSELPSGLYLVVLEAKGRTEAMRLLLLK